MKLEGKVALVTGSGRGIGRAIAIRFAREGADVVVNFAHHDDEAEETLAQVEAAGRRGAVIKADLGQPDEARRLVDDAIARLGRLDVLVNNAGVEKSTPFLEVSEADYDQVLHLNLRGAFFASQEFARHLIDARRPGKIINISSVHEEIPFPNFAPYCASKGGLRLLTRDLAVELGKHRITVNGVAPGAILTEMNRELEEDEAKRNALIANIPLGRIGRPEDVANVAAFLASAEADYVTGATYFVDGGLTWNYRE